MNRELIETVESLGGTALMGGILIQFSDTAFEQALKKIYEAGVEAEREACIVDIQWHIPRSGRHTPEYQMAMRMIERIRARKEL